MRRQKSLGHRIAREQIRKHGRDRYPTRELQMLKVVEETGELAKALLRRLEGADPSAATWAAVRKEYADTGLALFELGNKLDLDLVYEMSELVSEDDRRFGEDPGDGLHGAAVRP